MSSVGQLGAFGNYTRQIWDLRYFWTSLVRIDLRQRYKRSFLGVGWTLMHPLAMTAVLCAAFYTIFKIELRDYVPFLMTGMAFWTFLAATMTDGCNCFFMAQAFIKSERLPVAIFPLRVTLGTLLHFSIVLAVAMVVSGICKGYGQLWPLISLLPSICLLAVFGWSIATIAGFCCVQFPDTQHLSTIGLQMLFYLTPVMYPPSILNSRGIGSILKYNPLGYFVELIRAPIVYSQFPTLKAYLIAASLTVFMFAVAILFIKRRERKLIFSLI